MIQTAEYIAIQIAKEVKKKLFVEVEASGRHVHLSREDVGFLFGENYKLTPVKELSQPGQYACKERISVTGPKGTINNVVILGPERPETQVEISTTDSLTLGVKAPIRLSGDIKNSPGMILTNGDKSIKKEEGIIIAKRHIHMTPEDARRFNVNDGEIIKIKMFGERSVVFENVVARVNKNFATYVHIDYDEANACGFSKGALGIILK